MRSNKLSFGPPFMPGVACHTMHQYGVMQTYEMSLPKTCTQHATRSQLCHIFQPCNSKTAAENITSEVNNLRRAL